jgi:hypothetical protein
MYEYGTLKLVKVISRRGVREKRKINEGDKPNQSTIHVYM